ncbi:hypothetical protein TNIN_29411 [Trichonephila inaurata madagascariensis]|uniref:Retrovirus-related Pol polyprotein from transposon TNT 1-94-like beta-barrel domain-containing protein n=1 Tax=Trichonephila inaurata madagascariensis TaxID=2747483 RepID=A0A8X6YGD5_9ARAC|nr:hypothetical protein TNIN_29411 [Trichonephila inaurata madagascariensis]
MKVRVNYPFFLAEANLSYNVRNDAWILDTAASNHFTNNRDLFINFVDIVNENMVWAVNGVEFPIEGKGDKPQQNNSGAELASPGLKYSYEVAENCDDKTVNNIPVSLPKIWKLRMRSQVGADISRFSCKTTGENA